MSLDSATINPAPLVRSRQTEAAAMEFWSGQCGELDPILGGARDDELVDDISRVRSSARSVSPAANASITGCSSSRLKPWRSSRDPDVPQA